MTPKNALLTILLAALVAAVVSVGVLYLAATDRIPLLAVKAPAPDTAKLDRTAMGDLVRGYLLEHPEVLIEASNELDKRQQAAQEAQTAQAIGQHAEKIYRSDAAPVIGNAQGDVTVVEFFDYNCSFCRRALPDVLRLVNSDDKVRLVLKELPIFGADSEAAARVALAAEKQGKYLEMHQKLFTEPGKADKQKAMRIAEELGLDITKLEEDMQSAEVQKALDEARTLADEIGLQGTPLYLVGDRLLPGAPEDLYDQLARLVADIRQNGCRTAC